MNDCLAGYLTVAIGKKKYKLKGSDFGLEEGGDYDSSFLFIHFEDEDRKIPDIHVSFSTDGNELKHWSISPEEIVVEDKLEVPENFFNYVPEEGVKVSV